MKKNNLYQSFLCLESKDEVKRYLDDLLTPAEVEEFADRLYIAELLEAKQTYERINQLTSASSTTIARVNKWLKNGPKGYQLVLNRLHHHQSSSPHL